MPKFDLILSSTIVHSNSFYKVTSSFVLVLVRSRKSLVTQTDRSVLVTGDGESKTVSQDSTILKIPRKNVIFKME